MGIIYKGRDINQVFAVRPVVITSNNTDSEQANTGDILTATVTFISATVDITGAPVLSLDVGGNLRDFIYASGTGTDTLTFTYTVVADDIDTDGISGVGAIAFKYPDPVADTLKVNRTNNGTFNLSVDNSNIPKGVNRVFNSALEAQGLFPSVYVNTTVVLNIDLDGLSGAGNVKPVLCHFTNAGDSDNGWMLVAQQNEADPCAWNEGIQGDYDPNDYQQGFCFNNSEIPTHTETGVGRRLNASSLDPIGIGRFTYVYTSGNIGKTAITDLEGSGNYHIHRNTGGWYGAHDPDSSYSTGTGEWSDTLTVDKTPGNGFNFAFSRRQTSVQYRGYSYGGSNIASSSQTWSWCVCVR